MCEQEKTDVGNKRSIQWFLQWLDENGHSSTDVWDRIGDTIVKCLIAARPALAHAYRSSTGSGTIAIDEQFWNVRVDVANSVSLQV